MSLRLGRRLHFVPRWVVIPTIRRQNVAEHSFGVARIVKWLMDRHESGHEAEFVLAALEYALEHDDEEARTGDRPSPGKKRRKPGGGDQVIVIVKVADCLEAIAFLHEERAMGNRYGMEVLLNDIRSNLHDWWEVFDHKPHVKKAITSDLIGAMLREAVPVDTGYPHPGMDEEHKE